MIIYTFTIRVYIYHHSFNCRRAMRINLSEDDCQFYINVSCKFTLIIFLSMDFLNDLNIITELNALLKHAHFKFIILSLIMVY